MKLLKKLKIIFYILVSWIFLHSAYTVIDGLWDERKTADIGVILGNKVNEDGTLSRRLLERLQCGLNLFKEGRIKKIMVSGGLGKEGFYEGDKMKGFLIANGVPDTAIILDNNGNNTIATVENTLKLKDSIGFKSVLVISQYYHLTRTKMLFRERNFDNISSVSPKYFELRDLYSLLREFFAYYKERFF
jgi:vancomycin permeability regulator SanA